MCRLLGYLGAPIQLEKILYKPEHSLVVQSYQPRQMETALMNADGFGVGWYHQHQETNPFRYRNTTPIWSDINLPSLSRYVESGCLLGYVRSATPGLSVDMSNCQPFTSEGSSLSHRLLFTHNGYIDNFRKTLYRPIRNSLNDETYQSIQGTTDSEHIFALILDELQRSPHITLEKALANALTSLSELANSYQAYFCATMIVSDGKQLLACRYASRSPAPTLYWLRDDSTYPNAVIVASEPLFDGNWNSCPEQSIISIGEDFEVHTHQLSQRSSF